MAYKILNKLSPDSLWNKYQYRFTYSNYITMNCKDLQIPRLRTEHAKKGFLPACRALSRDWRASGLPHVHGAARNQQFHLVGKSAECQQIFASFTVMTTVNQMLERWQREIRELAAVQTHSPQKDKEMV